MLTKADIIKRHTSTGISWNVLKDRLQPQTRCPQKVCDICKVLRFLHRYDQLPHSGLAWNVDFSQSTQFTMDKATFFSPWKSCFIRKCFSGAVIFFFFFGIHVYVLLNTAGTMQTESYIWAAVFIVACCLQSDLTRAICSSDRWQVTDCKFLMGKNHMRQLFCNPPCAQKNIPPTKVPSLPFCRWWTICFWEAHTWWCGRGSLCACVENRNNFPAQLQCHQNKFSIKTWSHFALHFK